ncbi:MAG: hypothetical protein KC621_11360 [Myxococcales bacterium]|nr:hypothetical protein [Myxococcales bacterium]
MKQELDVLLEQLDELLGEPVVDAEDALEIAIVAGLAARLGGGASMKDAEAWRDGDGAELLADLWEQVDTDALIEALDEVSTGGATDEEVEEALFDVDDLVAAAIWCGQRKAVRAGAARAAAIVRQIPDVFAPLADLAKPIAKLPSVAEDLDLYDYWLAVTDAAQYA